MGGWGGGGSAMLQQDGHVIAYASRVLNKAECNYSVIQQGDLAAVYGMKKFRYYLLGQPFELWTGNEPLRWLPNQKLEGMLGRWVLAQQGYSFTVVYPRGSQNTTADALSSHRDPIMATLPAAVTRADIQVLLTCILSSSEAGPSDLARHSGITIFNSPNNYQLTEASIDKILPIVGTASPKRRHYSSGPTSDTVTVPINPPERNIAAVP